MGCVISKKNGEEEGKGVIFLCKERKKLLKLAVGRRYALADAQNKYNQCLYAVAAAIRLFVSRNSSHSSPFLITFPAVNDSGEEIPQIPTEIHKASSFDTQKQESSSEDEEGDDGELCEHFFGEGNDFGWDFFNPFDGFRAEMLNKSSELRELREKEGIPDLEDDKDSNFKVEDAKMENQKQEIENVSFRMIDTPIKGRELLEALKDVEDHFVKSYNSGLDVSKLLETRKTQLLSGMEDFKENSNKLLRSFTWSRNSRSSFSRSPSSKSFLSSSSRSSSTSMDFNNEIFDDCGGMESGSHSSTLGRLYAWERKLYMEVKVGEESRKMYERKCSHLRNGDGLCDREKTRTEVHDLDSRILVALRSTESISERIQKLRDEELQPQVIELLHGLMRNWKIMLECFETQKRILSEVQSFDCSSEKFSNDSHRLATLQLEAELYNWRVCFSAYVSAQKTYVEALLGWLSKFITPETKKNSLMPPLFGICRDWLTLLGKLPGEAVIRAMNGFRKEIQALWIQQGKEQQQKRKLDGLEKELDRRVSAFQRTESRILESKPSDHQGIEANVRSRIEFLEGRKLLLDMFKERVDAEKGKYQISSEETRRMTLSGFQTGFSSVFESMIEFSKANVKLYNELVSLSENAKVDEDKVCKTTSYDEEISSYLWN